MQQEIIIAGFGGQGIVLAGNILAKAAIIEEKNVTMMLSYGVEMRGGTANIALVVSDEEIASPIIENQSILLALNKQSFEKFEKSTKENIFINSTLVKNYNKKEEINYHEIPATKIADEIGNSKAANMVMLGILIKKTNILKKESVKEAIKKTFEEKKPELIDKNLLAFEKGYES